MSLAYKAPKLSKKGRQFMEIILTVGDIVFLVIILWFSRVFANRQSDVRRPIFAKHLKAIISRFSSGYFTRHFDVVLAVFYVFLAFDTFVRIVERIINTAYIENFLINK